MIRRITNKYDDIYFPTTDIRIYWDKVMRNLMWFLIGFSTGFTITILLLWDNVIT